MPQDKLTALRNSTEHILTMALENLFGQNKIIKAMGPATEDGFYFDFDSKNLKINEDNFKVIESEMHRLISLDLPITAKLVDPKSAKTMFKSNPFKLEWIQEILKTDKKIRIITIGKQGTKNYFPDVCKDQHLKSTGDIKAFKLLSVAGAYWRGDEKNQMLTRIYGTAFPTKKELDQHLKNLEEAKKRDHRILGPKHNLFVIHQDIGKGLPLLTEKGTIIKNQILKLERQLEQQYDFKEVSTPHIAKSEIYKRTGHWQHYRDVMYAPFGIDNEKYVLKPMNCPHHYMIYDSRPRSYKDLPIRLSEPGTCYRFEKTGELGGLTRVRSLCIDDAHVLMTPDQVESEFKNSIQMVKKMFKAFGLDDYYVWLSINDPSDAVKYIADAKTWDQAGKTLEKIVKDNQLKYQKAKGEASFYGPKIDFMVKDSIGREWQMSTLQLDLFMAKRLNLTYTDKKGKKQPPVILHRGLTGSLERTIGILIEHYAGAFPAWLAPTQAIILPVAKSHHQYAKKIAKELKSHQIRHELDISNTTLNAKIRQATAQKIPYLLVIGDKEAKSESVAVRHRSGKDLGVVKLDAFIQNLLSEIESKAIN